VSFLLFDDLVEEEVALWQIVEMAPFSFARVGYRAWG
jgi:hypothetical protein